MSTLSFENKSDDELREWVDGKAVVGSSASEYAQRELLRRSTVKVADEARALAAGVDKLCILIERFDRSSSRLARWMLGLTIVIGVLAVAQVVIACLAYCDL